MPREFKRSERVADALQRELAELLRTELDDPRVELANITSVDVSRDLASAKVFVSFIGQRSAEQCAEAIAALNGAAGFLRGRLGGLIRLRVMPRLQFIHDTTGDRGQRLAALIEHALASDERARRAEQS